MFRYWDGQSWSEQTTSDPSTPAPGAPVPPPVAPPTQVPPSAYPQQPVDPYQQQAQQQYAAQPQPGQYGGAGYGGPGYGAPGGPGGSNKGPLLIALAVLLIIGLAVGGFFGVRALTDDDGDDSADDSSQTEETEDETDEPTDETEDPTESPTDETDSPTESPTDTGPTGRECSGGLPGAGGEVSGDGSISGGDLTLPPVRGYTTLEPQILTTFTFADGVAGVGRSIEEQWISLYTVGGLPKASGYSDLAASVDQVITCMTDSPNFYRNFSGREDLEREAIQVDGHDAYAVTSEIRVDDPEITVDGDYSKVIVVDTGDDEEFGLDIAVVPIGNQKLIDQLEAATEQLLVDD